MHGPGARREFESGGLRKGPTGPAPYFSLADGRAISEAWRNRAKAADRKIAAGGTN